MHTQLTSTPNMQLVIPDLRCILRTLLRRISNTHTNNDVRGFSKQLVLGIAHKCLRALDVVHFAALFLNPGSGAVIIDLNKYLPWDEIWFIEALDSVDYRTSHKCVKNDQNQFVPVWLKDNQTVLDAIKEQFAARINIPVERAVSVMVDVPNSNLNLRDGVDNEDIKEMLT